MGAISIVNHINSWNVQTVSDVKPQTCLLDSCVFVVHIKIIKSKIMNLYVSFLNILSYFHLKYLLLSFHTYQGDVYPAQSHFWVNIKSSTFFWGGWTYLHKERSLQGLLQVIMTAESTQLLCSREISSQHFGLLKLFKLFPAHTRKHIINLKFNKILQLFCPITMF